MAVESADDLAVFVDPEEFGIAATYTPVVGSAVTINGIFENAYVEVDAGDEVGVQSTQPMFSCRTADLPSGGGYDDAILIAGETYKVKVIRPDGTGMTTLGLEKQ